MWSEVNVPSSYAAIAFATMPLFLLVFNWLAFERVRPSRYDFIALPFGLVGSGLVIATGESLSGGRVESFDILLLIVCPSVWALGSLLGRRLSLPKNILVSSALQMIGAALLLAVLSLFHGDWDQFHIAAVTSRSFWGLLYLAVGGSLLGYTAFAAAIKHLDPRLVGTYAFVNPIVAVALGYLVGEQVGQASILFGAALAVLSVVLTFVGARHRRPSASPPQGKVPVSPAIAR
jgi:drug/metabolite transporter (DMT)-like permease